MNDLNQITAKNNEAVQLHEVAQNLANGKYAVLEYAGLSLTQVHYFTDHAEAVAKTQELNKRGGGVHAAFKAPTF